MPRSGPGPVTGLPSSVIAPVDGWSRPAMSRSSVDLPQPDGPRMVTRSLSAIVRSVGSSARVGAPPRTPGKHPRHVVDDELAHARLHGNSRRLPHLNRKSEIRPITPMTMMPKMIWPVASSAWLSMIMWPMPEDEPISSATIT